MAPQFDPASAGEHPLALREGGDRRREERRAHSRAGPDRRRSQRRRQLLGHALLTSLTIGVPVPTNTAKVQAPSKLQPPSPLTRSAPEEASVIQFDYIVAAPPRGPYDELIIEAANRYGLDPRLIRSIVQVESAFNPRAVSRAGAKGLMQLRPPLARELRVHNPFDPRQNIMGGARYLRRLLDMHEGDIRLALASYNAGPGNVMRYGGVPPFQETQKYVKRIIALMERGPQT
jgi:soluble lytic murein transglycosylase-like protein